MDFEDYAFIGIMMGVIAMYLFAGVVFLFLFGDTKSSIWFITGGVVITVFMFYKVGKMRQDAKTRVETEQDNN